MKQDHKYFLLFFMLLTILSMTLLPATHISGNQATPTAQVESAVPIKLIKEQFDDYGILVPQGWVIFKPKPNEDEVDAFTRFRDLYNKALPAATFAVSPTVIGIMRFAALMPNGYKGQLVRLYVYGYPSPTTTQITPADWLKLTYPAENILDFKINDIPAAGVTIKRNGRGVFTVAYFFPKAWLQVTLSVPDEALDSMRYLLALVATSVYQKGRQVDMAAWKNLITDADGLPENIILPPGIKR
ncbi:MAG: hypothetical protein IT324_31950 [Anaerolineae bacterium]|nr:hypothetical protein [Anaerolineae bacterium]